MTANPSEAARNSANDPATDDLDTDPDHDALSPTDDAPTEGPTAGDSLDTRSAAEIAADREEHDADPPAFEAEPGPRPAIPAIPKWVVPAVSAVLVFLLLAFPLGWTIWGAVVGALVAAAISYAFVFRL